MTVHAVKATMAGLWLLIQCIAASARSFVTWFWTKDIKDRERLRNMAGWLNPVEEPTSAGDIDHWRKNRITEYVEHNSQAAAKAGSFVIAVAVGWGLLGWLAAAVATAFHIF